MEEGGTGRRRWDHCRGSWPCCRGGESEVANSFNWQCARPPGLSDCPWAGKAPDFGVVIGLIPRLLSGPKSPRMGRLGRSFAFSSQNISA